MPPARPTGRLIDVPARNGGNAVPTRAHPKHPLPSRIEPKVRRGRPPKKVLQPGHAAAVERGELPPQLLATHREIQETYGRLSSAVLSPSDVPLLDLMGPVFHFPFPVGLSRDPEPCSKKLAVIPPQAAVVDSGLRRDDYAFVQYSTFIGWVQSYHLADPTATREELT